MSTCARCAGTKVIPRAVFYDNADPDWNWYPVVRVAVCPDCYEPQRLTTIEMGKPGARYALMADRGALYDVHLAGESANGGTGPNICGLDRHARDENGRILRGFSVGGGVYGGPDYPTSHDVCAECLSLVAGRPISGTHAALFLRAVA